MAACATLADRLGVSESALKEALDELRPTGDLKADLAPFLADALGKSQAEVQTALEGLRGDHDERHKAMRDEFAAALAKELGLAEDKVAAALDKVKPQPPQGPRSGPSAGRRARRR